jgi:hypothetical protein
LEKIFWRHPRPTPKKAVEMGGAQSDQRGEVVQHRLTGGSLIEMSNDKGDPVVIVHGVIIQGREKVPTRFLRSFQVGYARHAQVDGDGPSSCSSSSSSVGSSRSNVDAFWFAIHRRNRKDSRQDRPV